MARPRGKQKSVRLSVSLDDQDYGEIQRIARDLDVSSAWVVRRAVTEYINRQSVERDPELPLRRSN